MNLIEYIKYTPLFEDVIFLSLISILYILLLILVISTLFKEYKERKSDGVRNGN